MPGERYSPPRRQRRRSADRVLVTLALLLACCALPTGCAHLTKSADGDPILLLVGLDGFRWDYLQRDQTPNLVRLAESGVRAERLIPVFPSKTFPNYYSIVTGLYPEHHGIVANTVFDPLFDATFRMSDRDAVQDGRWWSGEPIWVTAEKQGQITAPYFWVGSEAPIRGTRPTYWKPFDHDLPNAERIDQILTWIDLPVDRRPALLTIYFSDLDDAGHDYDPDSAAEVDRALQKVDHDIGRLLEGLDRRGLLDRINLIIVSDHGMTATSPERVIALDDYVDLATANVIDWSPVLALWPGEESVRAVFESLKGAHPNLEIFERRELPTRLHYQDHRRIAPIIGIADEGWSIATRSRLEERPESFSGGTHGYDPALESMGALFIASGPAFRRGLVVPALENVHLYNLMCEVLELRPAPNNGDPAVIAPILATRGSAGS